MPNDLNYILFADLIKKIASDSGSMDEINTDALKRLWNAIVTELGGDTGSIQTEQDIEIVDPTKGIVLTTADGTRARLNLIEDVDGDPGLTITTI